MGARKVAPIEVGLVTIMVPPGPMEQSRTVLQVRVIILVMGGEWHAAVHCQGVSWCQPSGAELSSGGQGSLQAPFHIPTNSL